ncbi:MAG: hypothetical protein J6A01_04900 [Proteobacteria bacterium]|nr:hypothetical protein [Pseudomonadota bacterium]
MKNLLHFISLSFVLALILPQTALADLPPMPTPTCETCAEECEDFCNKAPSDEPVPTSFFCSQCSGLNCNLDEVCKKSGEGDEKPQEEGDVKPEGDNQTIAVQAKKDPQDNACSASPLMPNAQNWSLFFILMALLGAMSFGAIWRLNRKSGH